MRDINSIVERLRKKFELKNETQVAKLLQVEQNTLSSWKKRGKIPYEKLDIIAQNNNLSLDWILDGSETEETLTELIQNFKSLPKEKQEVYFLRIKADALESKK